MKLLIIGLLACLVAAAWADNENDMYFTASGDGPSRATDLPPDDEDTDTEASGDVDMIGKEGVQDSNIAIDPEERTEEPEPSVVRDGRFGVKNILLKPVEEPAKNVDGEVNAAEEERDPLRSDDDSTPSAPSSQFLVAVIVGGCFGLLFAVCVIMLLVYRMRKKDEGSYALEFGPDSKKPQGNYEYSKGVDSKEYFA